MTSSGLGEDEKPCPVRKGSDVLTVQDRRQKLSLPGMLSEEKQHNANVKFSFINNCIDILSAD